MPAFERIDSSTYGEGWVQVKGGVAWVKQVAAAMDPGAVGAQITAYQNAADQIAYAQHVLKTTQGDLDASWSGQAATAAQQTFQGTVNHAQLVLDTINQDIVPHLQTVQQAQQEFISTMMNVPDEKPMTQEALQYLGTKTFMTYPANYPGKVLVEHNTAARTKAADALTKLAGSYSDAATKLNALGNNDGVVLEQQPSTASFNLGSMPSASGNGSAPRYRSSAHAMTNASGTRPNPLRTGSPGSVTTIGGGGTQLASNPTGGNPPSGSSPISGSPTPNPVHDPNPGPVSGQPVLPIGAQPPGSGGYGGGGEPIGSDPIGGGRRAGGIGRGGVTEFSDEPSESRLVGNSGANAEKQFSLVGGDDAESPVVSRNPAVGENAAGAEAVEGESRGGMASPGMGGLGGLGGGSGVGGGTSGSSRYNRGRYFDEPEDEDGRTPHVRSVFEDATDGQGNSLNLLSRRGAAERDDEDERRKRASHSKEDGLWDSAQRIVPPVIE